MVCEHIMDAAMESRKILDAPTLLRPKCHPRAKLDVYVDSKEYLIYLCCSRCDRVVDTVAMKWLAYGNKTRTNKRSKGKGKA